MRLLIFLFFLSGTILAANSASSGDDLLNTYTASDSTCDSEITVHEAKPSPFLDSSLINGIYVIGSEQDLNHPDYTSIRGVQACGVDFPGSDTSVHRLFKPYIGASLTNETLDALKRAIIHYYQDNNRPIVLVYVPEQEIKTGVVQIVVQEGRVGNVNVTGNKWFSSKKLQSHMRLKKGEVINSKSINSDLFWMNRNPFHRTDIIYSPGDIAGATDVELYTVDRFPLRIYTGIDNTGNDLTGNNRLFAGINWGNVFGTDQQFSYQYTTSSDFSRLQAHTAHYDIPLPWRHYLIFYGGYSDVKMDFGSSAVDGFKMRSHGFSTQASFRYNIPLKPNDAFLHEFIFGFDWKRTNNNLEFVESNPIVAKLANITQFTAGYNLGYENPAVTTSLEVEGFWSPTDWIADQSAENYGLIRYMARAHYLYFRPTFSLIWRFWRDFSIYNALRGQYANRNLLPSEEYGVGGYNTVRGYKERAINGDNAFIWNFELRTPRVRVIDNILHRKGPGKTFPDEIQFLVFFDLGWAGLHKPAEFEPRSQHAIGFGPGVRYNIIPYLTFRADYGVQLYNIPDHSGPHHRLHFTLIAGY